VKARKDAIVAESTGNLERWLRGAPNVTVIQGHGHFTAPHIIRVGDRQLEAPEIFINTGGRPNNPPIEGLPEVDYLTSSGMMDVDFLPEHLLVLGGSYVGLEFAQMYRRFGSRVTVVEMSPRLVAREDPEVSLALQAILEREGIEVRLEAECIRVEKGNGGRDGGIVMHVHCEREPREIAGRTCSWPSGASPIPMTRAGSGRGGDQPGAAFIEVDDQLATNVAGIWALGDVNGRGAFTHTSYNDYEIAAANLLDHDARRLSDRFPVYALFTDPPLARTGMTEYEALASGRSVLVGRRAMARVGRARERGETQGFMNVLVDAQTRKILGAALLGIEADEAIHCIIDVMNAGAAYTAISRAVHIHPTVSELIPTLLGELQPLQ
jgi:pyruvate/2-oxoglutarate dehydrogenase complex dihydrolipoamide dehydrogenase (E3) component